MKNLRSARSGGVGVIALAIVTLIVVAALVLIILTPGVLGIRGTDPAPGKQGDPDPPAIIGLINIQARCAFDNSALFGPYENDIESLTATFVPSDPGMQMVVDPFDMYQHEDNFKVKFTVQAPYMSNPWYSDTVTFHVGVGGGSPTVIKLIEPASALPAVRYAGDYRVTCDLMTDAGNIIQSKTVMVHIAGAA